MIHAPDFAEAFEAWRVWHVVRHAGEYSLASVVHRKVWPSDEALVAECLRRRFLVRLGRRERHEAPEVDCECGIYGAGLKRVGEYAADAPCYGVARVLGRVALWGIVIECARGWRASHAYPLRIYVPADAGDPWRVSWEEVAVGLWRYGVPVEPLASTAADATMALEEHRAA